MITAQIANSFSKNQQKHHPGNLVATEQTMNIIGLLLQVQKAILDACFAGAYSASVAISGNEDAGMLRMLANDLREQGYRTTGFTKDSMTLTIFWGEDGTRIYQQQNADLL